MSDYLVRVWGLRYFWMALVRSDLRSRYRRSILGMGWSLLHPIAMTVVLCTVFGKLFGVDIRTYAPHVLTGMTFWAFITSVMKHGCQCFIQGEQYIRQQAAPLAIYPLRTTLAAGFHFLLGLGVALAFVWGINGFANIAALPALIPVLVLLFMIAWSLAICMGILNVLFQDAQHLIEIALQIAFYLTPIIYPRHLLLQKLDHRQMGWLLDLNPFAVLLELLRRPLISGEYPTLTHVCIGSAITLLVMALATAMLLKFERRLIFYL